MTDLSVILPTRRRPELARRCIGSFRETVSADEVELILVHDDDDDSYASGFDDVHKIAVTRDTLVTAVNAAAAFLAPSFDAVMLVADDMMFRTPKWDEILLKTLEDMGGTGIVGWDDKRRYDVLEHVLMSSDIIRVTGHFAIPQLAHFFVDNAWTELGKRAGILRYCPDVVIEHLHYDVCPDTVHDETYTDAETTWGARDLQAFQEWRASQLANEVSVLRRNFSPDVRWVLSRVG